MKTATYGRSPVEIAEDQLVAMCGRVFNLSREEAVRYQQQRVEIAPEIRAKAEKLLDEWEGTDAQAKQHTGSTYLGFMQPGTRG